MISYDDFNDISPSRESRIPADRRERNPLITEEGFRNFLRLKQQPHAPVWNFETGDRITQDDLDAYHRFGDTLKSQRMPGDGLPSWLPAWIENLRPRVAAFRKRIPAGIDIEKDWDRIPTLNREDMLARIDTLVPEDADFDRLIVYDTSGTTGHAMAVPHHPGAVAKAMRMMEHVLAKYGIKTDFNADMTACLNVGIRANIVVFPNVFTVWNQAGFAKINLSREEWRDPADAQIFLDNAAPFFLTGDPLGFAEMLRQNIRYRPATLMSTALTMPKGLRERLEKTYACPVIDWYSATETGPIGYACAENNGFHVLPHDLYVEILDTDGNPVPPGEMGEITVTGGRNPYLPLLRYRTGDFGRLDFAACACGDPMPRILDLRGREPVVYLGRDGRLVNPVDIGRLLRSEIMARHLVVQHPDRSLDVYIKPVLPGREPDGTKIRDKLALLFGNDATIRVRIGMDLEEQFLDPGFSAYRSEFTMADFL